MNARGFTLIEMLTVVAIVAVLGAIATPAIKGFTASQNVRSASSDLHTALTRARSEAVKRNQQVSLVPVTTSQWTSGWKIADPSDATVLLDQHQPVLNVVITGPTGVTFNPSGRITGSTTPQFNISADGTDKQRCVKVDLSGRAYQLQTAC